jgi:L-threonylcarbamoyladenylate synthase
MKIASLNSINVEEIVSKSATTILSGGIVVLPFDTTYGYVCDPKNELALQKIFQLKRRDLNQTIGIAVNKLKKLKMITEIDKTTEEFIKERTPGKFTFILKNKSKNISGLCLRENTIAIRIPDSELILKIAERTGGVLAQTSANVSGEPNCNSIEELKEQLNDNEFDNINLIVDGGKIESTGSSQILDLTGPELREIERK